MGQQPILGKTETVTENYAQPRKTNGLPYTGLRTGTNNWTMNTGIRFGTWNVQTLNSIGALEKLLIEIIPYNLDILALQEVRWIGEGYIHKNGYKLFYGGTNKHELGTAFLVKNRHVNSVKNIKFVNERISYIQMKGKFCDQFYINVHAPTNVSEDETKDEFYDTLEQIYNQIPSYATKLF